MYLASKNEPPTRTRREEPLPRNDPKLFAPTRCRVIRAFLIAPGRVAAVGEVVEIPLHLAHALRGVKIEFLNAGD